MYVQVALTLTRFKYYAGWNLADASVRASGASYSPQGTWDLCENANVWKIETSKNEREVKEVITL